MLFLLSGFAPILPLLLFAPAFLLCCQAFPVGSRIFRRKHNLLDRQNIRHKLAETKPCPLAHFFILFHLALRESRNQKLHALLIHGKQRIIKNILIRIILQIVMKFIRKIDLQLRRCHLRKLHPANIIGFRRKRKSDILHADFIPAHRVAKIIRKRMKGRNSPAHHYVVRHNLKTGFQHLAVLHDNQLQKAVFYIDSQVFFAHI